MDTDEAADECPNLLNQMRRLFNTNFSHILIIIDES